MWARQPENLLIISVCIVVLAWLVLRLIRRSGRKPFTLKIRDPRKAHRWQSAEYIDKPTYCNACNELCVSGSCCESCGLCICTRSQCLKMASTAQTCKPLSTTGGKEMSHFWVKGNLPICSLCFRCVYSVCVYDQELSGLFTAASASGVYTVCVCMYQELSGLFTAASASGVYTVCVYVSGAQWSVHCNIVFSNSSSFAQSSRLYFVSCGSYIHVPPTCICIYIYMYMEFHFNSLYTSYHMVGL